LQLALGQLAEQGSSCCYLTTLGLVTKKALLVEASLMVGFALELVALALFEERAQRLLQVVPVS
jgi:hypothetical protein